MTGSAGQKRVPTNFLKNYEIPLPNLPEQKAIVAKLDRAQRLIDIDKEMLAKYDELIQSVFLEMFGDVESEKVSLSELVKLNPRKSEISDIDKSIEASFLGMADVGENGSLNLSEIQTIEESWKGYTYFKEDDVLFAKITPCMENGKGAIAKGLRNGLGFGSTEFHVLRPIEGVSRSAWIYHLTHSDKFRKIAESFMTGSAGQKRVPTHFFDRFRVVKPSIEKQIRFEEIATEISEDKKMLRSQIKKSDELFSSLVQGAFG
jgi:type I restriction enzyme S subunit